MNWPLMVRHRTITNKPTRSLTPISSVQETPSGRRYQRLLRALRQYDVKGLSATNPDQLKTVKPGRHNRQQPLPERFLALAKTVEGTPDTLRSVQSSRLIRRPQMSQEEFEQRYGKF
ncbi:TPA: hypothetical protein ACF1H3_004606 [Salmonella enterica]